VQKIKNSGFIKFHFCLNTNNEKRAQEILREASFNFINFYNLSGFNKFIDYN
jgi:hypothetical protein